MNDVLIVIRNISGFIIFATLLENLFAGSRYRVLFTFACSFMVVGLIATPLLRFMGKDGEFLARIKRELVTSQWQDSSKEIERGDELAWQDMLTQTEEGVRIDVASFCQVEKGDVESQIPVDEDYQIKTIQIKIKKHPTQLSGLSKEIASRYGVEESQVLIEVTDNE